MSSLNINEIDENKIPIKYILGIQENAEDLFQRQHISQTDKRKLLLKTH